MNTPRTLLDGLVQVAHRQMYIESGGFPDDPWGDAVLGQRNGLRGAGVPGFLTTATHTGAVHLRVEVHEAIPPLADEWDDVVEAAFVPVGDEVTFVVGRRAATSHTAAYEVRRPLLRFGNGYRTGGDGNGRGTARPLPAQFWQSDQGGVDRVIREGSDFAATFRAQVNER